MKNNLKKRNKSDFESKRGETSKVVAVRLPISLRESLYEVCNQYNQTPAYIIRQALAEYFRRHKEDKRREFINTRLQGWQSASLYVDEPEDYDKRPEIELKKKYRGMKRNLSRGN